ncbi:class I SAM-dependent methyltransferase [Oscillatoria amoena NRMC-F 0135]|nr:class I SAM-dependent methyltransferase [Oscillatoria amoena NRMC-F 0135]
MCDPKTQEAFELKITKEENGFVIEGELVSKSNTYPIVRGVPRFAGYNANENYAKSFGWQWNKWSKVQFDSENKGKKYEGYTQSMWEKITNKKGDLKGQLIADYGCGPGRFVETGRIKGAKVVGLDYSSAVEAARKNFANDPDVLIVQGDILAPPFKKGVFDGAFTIGVLHHTPDPKKGFSQIAESVKEGGWTACAVYGQGGYYDLPAVKFWRKVFKFLWPVFGHYPPLIYTYFVNIVFFPMGLFPWTRTLINSFFPFFLLKDFKWSILDTFDSITPSYQSGHTPYEVFMWFKENNYKNIEPSDWWGPVVNGIR